MDLNNLSRHDQAAIEEMNACPRCGGCTDEEYDGFGRCVCDGKAPVTSEALPERDRIPTRPEGVPVTMRKLVWPDDELDAELAQHAEAGQ